MFEYFANLNVIVAATLASVCIIVFIQLFFKRYRNLPPGTSSFSLLGDASMLKKYGMREVSKKYRHIYGEIFKIRILDSVIIVCCGYENLKELCIQRKHLFNDHSQRPIREHVFGKNGIIEAVGETWKHNRRFSLRTLRDFGLGKRTMETKILEEIEYLLDYIDKTNGAAFDIAELLFRAVSNVIVSVIFGNRYSYEDKEFQQYLLQLNKMTKFSSFHKYTWQGCIPGDPFGVREHINTLQYSRQFYADHIEKHFNEFNENETNDFIDVYIKHMKDISSSERDPFFNSMFAF